MFLDTGTLRLDERTKRYTYSEFWGDDIGLHTSLYGWTSSLIARPDKVEMPHFLKEVRFSSHDFVHDFIDEKGRQRTILALHSASPKEIEQARDFTELRQDELEIEFLFQSMDWELNITLFRDLELSSEILSELALFAHRPLENLAA